MSPEEIKRIRLKLGLTQDRFAELVGLSGPGVVSNIETGFRNPNRTILTLLHLLDRLPPEEANRLMQEMFKSGKSITGAESPRSRQP